MAGDALLIKIIWVPKRQSIGSELASEILLGEWRALVRQVDLLTDEVDAAAEPFFTQGLDTLNSGLTRSDYYDSLRHGRQG